MQISDLGNATPVDQHFTEDIQTRQYRAPEAIIQRSDWGFPVDIWSVACLVCSSLVLLFVHFKLTLCALTAIRIGDWGPFIRPASQEWLVEQERRSHGPDH